MDPCSPARSRQDLPTLTCPYTFAQGGEPAPGPSQPEPKRRRVQFSGFPEIPDSPLPNASPRVDRQGSPAHEDDASAAEIHGATQTSNALGPHMQMGEPGHAPTAGEALFGGGGKPLRGVRYCFLGLSNSDPVRVYSLLLFVVHYLVGSVGACSAAVAQSLVDSIQLRLISMFASSVSIYDMAWRTTSLRIKICYMCCACL